MSEQSTSESDRIGCEYVATADEDADPCPIGHTDAEEINGDVVTCTAEADVVLRPPGTEGLTTPYGKTVVCWQHAQYLRNEAPKEWEQCGENPSNLRGESGDDNRSVDTDTGQ